MLDTYTCRSKGRAVTELRKIKRQSPQANSIKIYQSWAIFLVLKQTVHKSEHKSVRLFEETNAHKIDHCFILPSPPIYYYIFSSNKFIFVGYRQNHVCFCYGQI